MEIDVNNPDVCGTIYVVKNYFSFTIGEKGKELLDKRISSKDIDEFIQDITYAKDDFIL